MIGEGELEAMKYTPERQELPQGAMFFRYRNHRGEESTRTITWPYLWYGTTSYYPEPGWLLRGFDEHKRDYRDFSVVNILHFGAGALPQLTPPGKSRRERP